MLGQQDWPGPLAVHLFLPGSVSLAMGHVVAFCTALTAVVKTLADFTFVGNTDTVTEEDTKEIVFDNLQALDLSGIGASGSQVVL